jgi:superfamily II DNA or RNA helicase
MPTQDELIRAKKSSLSNAIREKHGGYLVVAQRLGLTHSYSTKKGRDYWKDVENIKKDLERYIANRGEPGRMPTQTELASAGRSDLVNAISKKGGFRSFAGTMGLSLTRETKPPGYWVVFENVEREILDFNMHHGQSGVMPTATELLKAGYSTLAVAIGKYHGGYADVAKRLGLALSLDAKPRRTWGEFAQIEREILEFIAENGTPDILPTVTQLRKAKRFDLVSAYKKFGGSAAIAKHMGLKFYHGSKPAGYWDETQNLESALREFISQHSNYGVMPKQSELTKAGRSDLVGAINRNGGFFAIAQRLGLKVSMKDRGYWADLENIKRELQGFIAEYGQLGVMPTKDALAKAGRTSLATAITSYGGSSVVARMLGLIYTSPEHITPRTASSVEKTARAIQPLAESNLLSPAQVMVILRRAGLLEFRNQRVVKLGASLARGDHAEIESAIANLVSGGEEIATETVAVEERDDLTAAEAEALLGEGLEAGAGLNPPLKAPADPDIESEQALIRGLSALGELRLPLDEVLSLLTSKVLWQEFYKRLYAWYGSLDATQTVTADDVEAAILAAYPEHTANEFVAESSALFTFEVEQAVNFAASLPEYGWRGPRLRLHQADAARRMADVLGAGVGAGGHKARPYILNADDPGMGKSASFLAAVAACGIRNIVIVAPKTVADDTWCGPRGEIKIRLPQARIVRGLERTLADLPASRLTFYVLHYEELLNEEAVAALAEKMFDCLCLDEIHFIKQRAGQDLTRRREALEKLRASARAAIGLTGTPLVNELAEPMSLLQTLSQHASQFDHSRLSSRRLRDIADVFEALLPHVVRRRKREVLLHLPGCDVRTVDIPLPPDLDAQMLEIYGWPRSQASHALVELRKLAVEAKLPYLLQRAQAARKLLILTYLTDDVSEKIAAYLDEFFPGQIAHINGSIPKNERQTLLDSFRSPDGARVLVGTIGTIGVGLTLFDPKQADTANEIIFTDLPYTWAEFEQGLARLHREGQKQTVRVDVLQTTTTATLRDGSAHHTLDERIWALIEGKRELSDVAIDGKYDTTDAADKVQKALRRWLKQAREIGVEPLAVERRPETQSEAQKWRGEIGRLRSLSAARADEVFADPEYTRQFLAHLETSTAAKLSHQWLRGRLTLLMRPDLAVVDMGCGLNPFAGLPCRVTGLDRHDRPGQLRGKMENPPLPDKSADVLIYSLSLYGTAADLKNYFSHAARILRGGGHLFIVEPDSAFTSEGVARFVDGLRQFGFELVGTVKELRGENGTLLKALHLTLTGDMGDPPSPLFERK